MPVSRVNVKKGTQTIPAATARRLLLHAQGLLDDPDRPARPARLCELIQRMGFVQLDTINVIDRAHNLTLFSRMRGYRPAMLGRLLERDRLLFEHWTHDASVIPTEWFAHWRPRFERYRQSVPANRWWRARVGDDPDAVVRDVLERIRVDGPVMSKDFEHDRNGESSAWWGWKPQKAALEYLWRAGDVAVARRVNFHKVYDLTERVLPAAHARPAPEREEHIDWVCRSALERLGGVASASELAAFWRAIPLADARAWCEQALASGDVVPATVKAADGSSPRRAVALPDWSERAASLPDPPAITRLLSPFDPVLRDRARALRLFGFDYRFEAFVPAPKRVFGYYVMPILERDSFVGKIDAKLHRDRGELEVRGLWWEAKVKPTRARRAGLEAALAALAAFTGAARHAMPGRASALR